MYNKAVNRHPSIKGMSLKHGMHVQTYVRTYIHCTYYVGLGVMSGELCCHSKPKEDWSCIADIDGHVVMNDDKEDAMRRRK